MKRKMSGNRTVRSVGKIAEAVLPQDRGIPEDVDFEDISVVTQGRPLGPLGLHAELDVLRRKRVSCVRRSEYDRAVRQGIGGPATPRHGGRNG